MGDLIQNNDCFKKLGFDSSNQWIFYGEGFEKFFEFFAQNINDANILNEFEVLECEEVRQRGEYLEPDERLIRMKQIEGEYPGLMEYDNLDLQNLTRQIEMLEQEEALYETLLENMRITKTNINYQLIELEENISDMITTEAELVKNCQEKSKQLEDLQKENLLLCNESKDCFTKIQSPPLFMHQLPLEQYFRKCDTFMQYFTLYVKENFKIQDYIDLDNSNQCEAQEVSEKLEILRNSLQHYTMAYLNEKSKIGAIQYLIDSLDLSKIHVVSLADMERETHELELLNEHHLKVVNKTLLNDLEMHVQQHTQQQIELILYENTKQKLSRALNRRENVKRLSKIVSDALSNAELVWVILQLDLERIRNRSDNADQMNAEAQRCLQRIDIMKHLQSSSSQSSLCEIFIEKVAESLSQHLGNKVRAETKMCLYEYEKFGRLFKYTLQNVFKRKSNAQIMEVQSNLTQVETLLRPLVYDSPVETPMFENVFFLESLYNAKANQSRMEKIIRNLRIQYQENISDRMVNDKFWRYSQLLWIWFLTDPKRMLQAIEEVKKAASKVPSLTGIKSLSGIKRV